MMRTNWMRGMAAAGLSLAICGGAVAQDQPANRGGDEPKPTMDMPGPIDSLQDVQDTGKMVFKLADTNNDGQISQKEAVDAGNLVVGGFFFRADANGDGTVSQEEARQARDALLSQKPFLRMMAERAREARAAGNNQPGSNPIRSLGNLLDSNNDKNLQASEVRQAVQTTVTGLFDAADTNRDGQMSPSEVNAALVGAIRAAGQAAFQAADTDRNGSLSQAEFDKAIIGPAHMMFRMVDRNNDNQLSPEEGQAAQRIIMSRIQALQFQEPANAPSNLIESGRTPRQAAPIPEFPVPTQPRQPTRTTPAPAGTTTAPAPAATPARPAIPATP